MMFGEADAKTEKPIEIRAKTMNREGDEDMKAFVDHEWWVGNVLNCSGGRRSGRFEECCTRIYIFADEAKGWWGG